MNKMFGFLLATLSAVSAVAKINSPKGFYEYSRQEGDLNGDKKSDVVVVWTSCRNEECGALDEEHPPKIITEVYLRESGKDGFKLLDKSEGLVCFRCGGVKGGDFVGDLSLNKKGILEVSYFGGSRWTWQYLMKWRLDKKNKFSLIGSTYTSTDTAMEIEGNSSFDSDSTGNLLKSDINYSTRQIEYSFVNKKLKAQTGRCQLKPDYHVPEFSQFKYGDFKTGDDHCPRN